MQSQFSLTEMAAELERRAKSKVDFVANTKQLEMDEKGQLSFDAGKGKSTYGVNDIAHGQIANRLEIPTKYYNRMRAEDPALLSTNVNRWLQKEPEQRMIRTLDGNARAFLSDKYQRIENEEIANMVLPALLEQQGVHIASCAITDQRMYIKAVFTHIRAEVSVGDVVQSGVSISNSEVGMGAVNIEPFVERLVCTNGMVIRDSKFSARHVGARAEKSEGVYQLLSDEALQADDRAILLKVRDVVRASFDQVRFEKYVQQMREARGDKIEGDIQEAVKVLGKKQGLSEFEGNNVLRHLIEGGDLSRWGMLNAVTRTAQDVSSYDRSHELETLGGNILTLPRSEWKVMALAEAA